MLKRLQILTGTPVLEKTTMLLCFQSIQWGRRTVKIVETHLKYQTTIKKHTL